MTPRSWASALIVLVFCVTLASGQTDAILQQFYNEMDGANTWISTHGWDGTRGSDPCATGSNQWYGIVCSGAIVQSINLNNNNLVGPMSGALAGIPTLVHIFVGNNAITSLPSNIGTMLNLEVLYAYNNQIATGLDENWGGAVSLQKILLYSNSITGSIPASWCSLSALETLDLHDNNMSGDLPSCLGALTALEELDLASNNFAGPLPDVIGDLPDGVFIYLDSNAFTGAVPDAWNTTVPALLDISDNLLSCRLPAWMLELRTTTIYAAGTNTFMCPQQPCAKCFDVPQCQPVVVSSHSPDLIDPFGASNLVLSGSNLAACPGVFFQLNSSVIKVPLSADTPAGTTATIALPSNNGVVGAVLGNIVYEPTDGSDEVVQLTALEVFSYGVACPVGAGGLPCSGLAQGLCRLTGLCECYNGWLGADCNTRPPCPCVNGGTCDYSNDTLNGADGVCVCPPEYVGQNCQNLLGYYSYSSPNLTTTSAPPAPLVDEEAQAALEKKLTIGVIIGIIIVAVVVVAAVGVGVYFWRKTADMKARMIEANSGANAFGEPAAQSLAPSPSSAPSVEMKEIDVGVDDK